jgi:hypothetical protein
MEFGEPIRSIREGTISRIVDFHDASGGKMIFVRWEDGKTAVYGHLSQYADSVKVGQHVNVGDLLGYAGSTGFSTGNHLHFAIKEGQRFLDPSPYINDIQNMNNLNHLVQQEVDKAPEIITKKVDFFHFMSQHMNGVSDTLTNLKLQFVSTLSYDVLFLKIFENLSQLLSVHSDFLNLIVTHII